MTPIPSHVALPTRLLCVESLGYPSARICHKASLPHHVSYTALSHCWGRKSVLTLKTANLLAFESRIEFSSLPKTFQDAIHVTRFLGIEYTWIDCPCIIQDSIEDWQRESARMDNAYFYSYCNIAATSSSDSQGGSFTERSMYDLVPVILNPNEVGVYPAWMNGHEFVTALKEGTHHKTHSVNSKIEEGVLEVKNVPDRSRATMLLTSRVNSESAVNRLGNDTKTAGASCRAFLVSFGASLARTYHRLSPPISCLGFPGAASSTTNTLLRKRSNLLRVP